MVTLNATNLCLDDIEKQLNLYPQFATDFTAFVDLPTLTDSEQQELFQIRSDFLPYLSMGKVSEGLVKALTLYPLLRLAGFYHPPFQIRLEEAITTIEVTEQDTSISGRFDILIVSRKTDDREVKNCLWILMIEAKNSLASPWAGLPQLLTYLYSGLHADGRQGQRDFWGLVSNGHSYQFVYISIDNPTAYHLLPMLELTQSDRAIQLLQVFKGIQVSALRKGS